MRTAFLLLLSCFFCGTIFAQHRHQPAKPVVGISCSYPDSAHSSVRKTYVESVLNAGGLPILIPVMTDEAALEQIIDHIDALILSGGEDIHPSYYGEEPIEEMGRVNDARDIYDLALIRLAAERNMPLLGICRGEQLINVAFGGTLYQDIPAQRPDTCVNHAQQERSTIATHRVTLLPGSVVATITGQTELLTNSHHHQAVKDVANGFRATAWTCDGIPEAIEAIDGRPIWGVQFHPEPMAMQGDSIMVRFFDYMVHQAARYKFKQQSIETD